MSSQQYDDSSEFNELLDLYPSMQASVDHQFPGTQAGSMSQSGGGHPPSNHPAIKISEQDSQQTAIGKKIQNKQEAIFNSRSTQDLMGAQRQSRQESVKITQSVEIPSNNFQFQNRRSPQNIMIKEDKIQNEDENLVATGRQESFQQKEQISDYKFGPKESPVANFTETSKQSILHKDNSYEEISQEKSIELAPKPPSSESESLPDKLDLQHDENKQGEIIQKAVSIVPQLPPIKGALPSAKANQRINQIDFIEEDRYQNARQKAPTGNNIDCGINIPVTEEILGVPKENAEDTEAGDMNHDFQEYSKLFKDLTISRQVDTQGLDVVNIIINSQSTHIIALAKPADKLTHFQVNIYEAETLKLERTFPINDDSLLIKADKIKQNDRGDTFCITYNDNGKLHLFIFSAQKVIVDFNIMTAFPQLPICEPIIGLLNPLAVCTFVTFDKMGSVKNNDKIFCSFYNHVTYMHYHFIYDIEKWQAGQLQSYKINDCRTKNFPFNCFYIHNEDHNEAHIFYRQGGTLKAQIKDVRIHEYEKIADIEFGDMFLWRNRVLVLRSSQQIVLFKYEFVDEENRKCWQQYHQFDSRGFISGSKKMPQFQVIEDKLIYFYEIDTETLIPRKVNVMMNFLKCSMAIFGDKGKYCITFKQNQKDFFLFQRKYQHDFKVPINTHNFEQALGLAVDSYECFLVSCRGNLYCFDSYTYQLKYKIDDVAGIRDHGGDHSVVSKDDILYMTLSKDGQFVALSVGYSNPAGIEFIEKIIILAIEKGNHGQFIIVDEIYPEDLYIESNKNLTDISKKIYFDDNNRDCLIFANKDIIIEYNYIDQKLRVVFDFDNLDSQPEYFRFNESQTVCLVSTLHNSLYIDLEARKQIDLDNIFGISGIKFIKYYGQSFYILANKRDRKLGFILLKLPELNPIKNINDKVKKEEMFLINEKNTLDIDDVMMSVLEENETEQLVISFKTIYINMYCIQVLDLKTGQLLYKHESFCMWETFVSGFLNNLTNDYISFDQNGLWVMALSSAFTRKKLNAHNGSQLQVHSMSSCQYFKLHPTNIIMFQFAQRNNQIILIQDCYKNEVKDTCYNDIFKIRITTGNIRQLLQIQSVAYCEGNADIKQLVEMQGRYEIFYQSFLELDRRNLVSILAFSSAAMSFLLHDDRQDYFDETFPIFYRNQSADTTNTAIDVAFKNNQIRAVSLIIDHIVKHQNNYVSSFLFTNNLTQLMDAGIDLIALLQSQIFYYEFEFAAWPGVHTNEDRVSKPYNGAIFTLRNAYNEVFPEIGDVPATVADTGAKISKIVYTLNLLPTINEPEDIEGLMKLAEGMNDEDTLAIFQSEALINLIEYKWDAYAYFGHYVGCFFHICYILFLSIYIYLTYCQHDELWRVKYGLETEEQQIYVYLIIVGFLFPFCYESLQIARTGIEYLKDSWNYTDITFAGMGALNIYYQLTEHSARIQCTATLTVVLILALFKTFFYLRIFASYAPLVSLMKTVIIDLGPFMFFYGLLMFKFSLIIGVIGFQNKFENYEDQDIMLAVKEDSPKEYPGAEYKELGHFIGNIVTIFRMSMGDNDMPALIYLGLPRMRLFWPVWVIICYLTFIIFFNFVIAEASKSYATVTANLDNILMQEKVALVNECEDIMFNVQRTKQRFPKLLITRDSIN